MTVVLGKFTEYFVVLSTLVQLLTYVFWSSLEELQYHVVWDLIAEFKITILNQSIMESFVIVRLSGIECSFNKMLQKYMDRITICFIRFFPT